MAAVTGPRCLPRDARIAALQRCGAQRAALVRDRTARRGTPAAPSSTPPSAHPPQAPRPVPTAPTGTKPAAPPGHPAHRHRRLPPPRLTRPRTFVPERCDRGHEPWPPAAGRTTPSRPGIKSPRCRR